MAATPYNEKNWSAGWDILIVPSNERQHRNICSNNSTRFYIKFPSDRLYLSITLKSMRNYLPWEGKFHIVHC